MKIPVHKLKAYYHRFINAISISKPSRRNPFYQLCAALVSSIVLSTTSVAADLADSYEPLLVQEQSSSFCRLDGSIDNRDQGYRGAGYANTVSAKGAEIIWNIKSEVPQQFYLAWRYANGSNGKRPATLYINENRIQSIDFNSTGHWTAWRSSSMLTSSLMAGYNTLRLVADAKDGLANIDSMLVGAGHQGALGVGDCGQFSIAADDVPDDAVMTAEKPTIWYASDSTVRHYKKNSSDQQGVGQRLPEFLMNDVSVANYAKGGRSIRTFKTEGFWGDILDAVQAGDVIFIEFGINDRSDVPDKSVFKDYLRDYVKDARAKHAIPVFVTPTPRNQHKNGVYTNAFTKYCEAKEEVAKELSVPLIDLQTLGRDYYTKIGVDKVTNVMMKDTLHLRSPGAYQMARLLAKGLSESNLYPLRNKVIQENLDEDRQPEVDGWNPRTGYTHN